MDDDDRDDNRKGDEILLTHAMTVVGRDDAVRVSNTTSRGCLTRGSLLDTTRNWKLCRGMAIVKRMTEG